MVIELKTALIKRNVFPYIVITEPLLMLNPQLLWGWPLNRKYSFILIQLKSSVSIHYLCAYYVEMELLFGVMNVKC
jgi:hypothetical protein